MATDYERMQQRDQARAVEMRELFHAIAKLMPGWSIKRDEENDTVYRSYVLERDGMSIHFSRDNRVNIGTWDWPKYRYTERGDERTAVVTPRDLYDPKEDSPSISCSISRGAEAIVRDLNKRFLPDYERIYGRCMAKAQALQESANKARAAWAEVCHVISKDPKHDRHYINDMVVENRDGVAHVTLDLTANQLRRVINAFTESTKT